MYVRVPKKTVDQLINKLDECQKLLEDLEEMAFFRDGANSSFNDVKERFEFIQEHIEELDFNRDSDVEKIECDSINDEFKYDIAMKIAEKFSLNEMFRLENLLNKQ